MPALLPPRAAHDTAGLCAGVLAVFKDLSAVDEYVEHSGGILMRLFKRRVVLDFGRVKNDDVRRISRLQ